MIERRFRITYHYDGMGGDHDLAHKALDQAAGSAQMIRSIRSLQENTFLQELRGHTRAIRHAALHTILETANGVSHPQEEASLARFHAHINQETPCDPGQLQIPMIPEYVPTGYLGGMRLGKLIE